MKKIIAFITFGLLMLAGITAQERSVNLAGAGKVVDIRSTKHIAYNGNTSDRLIPTTRDTIDYFVIVDNYDPGPLHFYARLTLSPVAGTDTTVLITVQEKKFAGESYTDIIASAATSVVSTTASYVKTSLGVTTEFTETLGGGTTTTRLANTLLRYRYLKIRLILPGDDTVGTGIKVDRVELQFFQ